MAQRQGVEEQACQNTPHPPSRSSPTQQHQQQQQVQQRYDESWVEVTSQPSSSSLSSIGDEIVTTGLNVGSRYNHHRRRRLRKSARQPPRQQQTSSPSAAGNSSQEEYDETDSSEDHPLASSAEAIHSLSSSEDAGQQSEDGDDATALGRASNKAAAVFQPLPNAFSHPPAQLGQRSYSTNAAIPPHPHHEVSRRSFSGRTHSRAQQGPSFMSPSVREDNDAALRASLTTLLSCAAAARGLPKTNEEDVVVEGQRRAANNGVGPSNQPMELRLVPEAELVEGRKTPVLPQHERAPTTTTTTTTTRQKSHGETSLDNNKAKSSAASTGRSSRVAKKKKAAGAGATAVVTDDALISPTLLTWVVSAGVVVLVSVVGFSAGYVIGREVGRQEGLAASLGGLNDTASSGREAIRSSGGSLRRFKWGAVGRSIVAAA